MYNHYYVITIYEITETDIHALYLALSINYPISYPSGERNALHRLVDQLLGELRRALIAGKTIELRGFGSFEVGMRRSNWPLPLSHRDDNGHGRR